MRTAVGSSVNVEQLRSRGDLSMISTIPSFRYERALGTQSLAPTTGSMHTYYHGHSAWPSLARFDPRQVFARHMGRIQFTRRSQFHRRRKIPSSNIRQRTYQPLPGYLDGTWADSLVGM
ncbi:hypothetical protein AB1N83_011990 [Pleurotus pulmonarius]